MIKDIISHLGYLYSTPKCLFKHLPVTHRHQAPKSLLLFKVSLGAGESKRSPGVGLLSW